MFEAVTLFLEVVDVVDDFFGGFENFHAVAGWESPASKDFVGFGLGFCWVIWPGTDSVNEHLKRS